jgi:RimJ/RimL family protein N-acetyltransferase
MGSLTNQSLEDNVMRIEGIRFKNGILTLRPYQVTDIEPCFNAIRESINELLPWMWWCHSNYSINDTQIWIGSRPDAWENAIECSFAIIDSKDGSFLGGCGLSNINRTDRCANLGYWVRTSRSRQGVAPAAALGVARFAFKEVELNRAEIVIATENKASIRVAEKIGALREGILRKRIVVRDTVYDACMFSLLADDVEEKTKKTSST